MNLKKIVAASVASVMAMGTMAVAANALSAGLVYQTNAWTFRNSIAQSEAIWWDPDFGDQMNYDNWKANDVEITGDGTYTVSFEKDILEDCKDGPEKSWNILGLQTDIRVADYPDVQITIDSMKVDGVEIPEAKNAVLGTEDPGNLTYDDYADGCNGITSTVVGVCYIGFQNNWNPDEQVIDPTASFGSKVEVTFTVSGLGDGSDDEGAASDDEGAASDDEGAASGDDGAASGSNDAPAAGTGSTNTATGSNKGNADTGIEGVAVVAGIAVLAAGAIVVAKKRK